MNEGGGDSAEADALTTGGGNAGGGLGGGGLKAGGGGGLLMGGGGGDACGTCASVGVLDSAATLIERMARQRDFWPFTCSPVQLPRPCQQSQQLPVVQHAALHVQLWTP